MMFVGVDGCRAGWLAIKINESDTWGAEVYTDFTELWSGCQDASLILVDIPIGLKEQGREERLCDKPPGVCLDLTGAAVYFEHHAGRLSVAELLPKPETLMRGLLESVYRSNRGVFY